MPLALKFPFHHYLMSFKLILIRWSIPKKYQISIHLFKSANMWPTCLSLCVCCHVQLFATLWTLAHKAPLSMGFSRQEYWAGCHSLFQWIFPTQGSNPDLHVSFITDGFFTSEPLGKPNSILLCLKSIIRLAHIHRKQFILNCPNIHRKIHSYPNVLMYLW